MLWMSEGEKSFDRTEEAFVTQNFASRGSNSSHGSAYVPSKRSSKLSAGFCVADEADPTVAHLGNFIAEIIDFIFQDALETEMAGSNQFISFSMHELILKRGGILRNRAYMFSDSTDYVFRTYRLFLTLPVRL